MHWRLAICFRIGLAVKAGGNAGNDTFQGVVFDDVIIWDGALDENEAMKLEREKNVPIEH